MKVINSKLIIPTVEYTDFIVDLIRNNLFLNTPNDYNNLNILIHLIRSLSIVL